MTTKEKSTDGRRACLDEHQNGQDDITTNMEDNELQQLHHLLLEKQRQSEKDIDLEESIHSENLSPVVVTDSLGTVDKIMGLFQMKESDIGPESSSKMAPCMSDTNLEALKCDQTGDQGTDEHVEIGIVSTTERCTINNSKGATEPRQNKHVKTSNIELSAISNTEADKKKKENIRQW